MPPYINRDKILLNPKVVINQTTVINCPAEGKPSPEITWYKNGIQLDATLQKRHEILAGGRQLRVKGAQLTDAGTYQCLAVNKAGEDSVDFQLTVLGMIHSSRLGFFFQTESSAGFLLFSTNMYVVDTR